MKPNRVQRNVLLFITLELSGNLSLTINDYCALVWIRERILRRLKDA